MPGVLEMQAYINARMQEMHNEYNRQERASVHLDESL
jgi:hypothetical protein